MGYINQRIAVLVLQNYMDGLQLLNISRKDRKGCAQKTQRNKMLI